ncbi:MAG: DUF6080 domain-containing protein [Prevotella sp.]|jgi:hypothetical protein|nr:DUF6080 domain-containing protein [Prevotella sp.]MCI1282146.1 DUF6080 domain-containing protein [Prevotella sp.]
MKILNLFKIRKEERWIALLMLGLLIALNTLTILKYYGIFTPLSDDYWNLFVGKFHVSGFDPITYYVVSDWEARYNVYRHPLLSFIMWLPYIVNQGCMWLFGINCVQFVVALILIFSGFYSFIFMHRICRDIIGLGRFDAGLLSLLLFSFAFVMLSSMVPDHFILSMFMLLLTLYISGMLIKEKQKMGIWTTILLFFATAGISLNNGLKVFLAGLFVNQKRFFRIKYLLFAVLFPALLIWIGSRYEYHFLVAPHENARHALKAAKQAEKKKRDTIDFKAVAKQQTASPKPAQKPASPPSSKPKRVKKGAPLMNGEFMRWTDVTTSRGQSAVENLMGESIQLHPDYLLQDEYSSRPMIVKYRWAFNYGVEALLMLLFIIGIWCGRNSRFLWLSLSFFALDMVLHMILGFGINEVYIMSAHWIYVIPIAIAYFLRGLQPLPQRILRVILVLLTMYLYVYNGYFIIKFMLC